jgi:hypothetical protein
MESSGNSAEFPARNRAKNILQLRDFKISILSDLSFEFSGFPIKGFEFDAILNLEP